VKTRLSDRSPENAASRHSAQAVLTEVLDTLLKLLHPIIPHVTEEIRSHLKPFLRDASSFLVSASWPLADEAALDPKAEREVDRLLSLVRAARVIRDRMGIPWTKNLTFLVRPKNADVMNSLLLVKERALSMGRLDRIDVGLTVEKPPQSAVVVEEECEIFIPLEGLIDLKVERERLTKEIGQVQGFITGIESKLANASFVEKAPAAVIDRERGRLGELKERLEKLQRNQAEFL
jgi:valyl-tRNA synthetase